MTVIITKNSSTASAVPTTADLVKGELAVNVTDKRIFTENNSTQIVELGTNPSTVTTATATVTGTLTANGTFASSNAVVTGGSVNSTPIGATTPSTVRGTTVTATTGFVGGLTGNVTGNLTGNVTGNVVGNVTGDLTGNVTASSGTSTVNNLVVNGTVDFTNTRLTDVAEPIAGSDAATKTYVDTSIAAVIDGAPAALDTLNELAAALNDDASFHTTVTNSLAGKLPLAGGTMTGQLSLGANKIVSVADPTLAQDVATKAYVDAADSTGLPLSGGTMSGAIAMGTNKITGLGTPTDAADATTKAYTDSILGSATSAADSAAAASTSESNAATSASNAASSATASSNSANASASSASEAATTYDNFDDRYLGQKASDPTLDNDGDALLTGALYFNTTSDAMKVYTGAAWVAVAPVATSITVSQISDYTGTATELNYTDGVTSNIQTQLDAKAPLASPTFTGTVTADGLSLGDNDKATFGDGNDLEIYHDGSNSIVADVGTGGLFLSGSSYVAILNGDRSEYMLNANVNGEVGLYYDGSKKLATTATGIDVTGTVTATSFSGDGSALTGVDSLPSQTGNAGEFLTTDGTNPSWTPLSLSPSLDATASGAIADGDKVIMNSNGTVSTVTPTINVNDPPNVSGRFQFEASSKAQYVSCAYDVSANKTLIVYRDFQNGGYLTGIVATLENGSLTFGTPVVMHGVSVSWTSVTYHEADNKHFVFYNSAGYGTYRVVEITGTTPNVTNSGGFSGADNPSYVSSCYDPSTDRTIVAYSGPGDDGTAFVANLYSNSVTIGSLYTFDTNQSQHVDIFPDTTNNKLIISYQDGPNSDRGTVIVASSATNNTLTFGTKSNFTTLRAWFMRGTHDASSGKNAISYSAQGNNSGYATMIVVSVSGYTPSFGSPFTNASVYSGSRAIAYNPNTERVVLSYNESTDLRFQSFAISGTSFTSTSSQNLGAPAGYYLFSAFDTVAERTITAIDTNAAGQAVIVDDGSLSTNLTEGNYIGISNATYSDGQTATVQIVGAIDDAQSGLVAGNKYYVQKNGSLATTSSTPSVVAGTSISATELIVKG